MSVIIRILLGK